VQITNIHEAKTNFSKLVERVAAGEEIIIGGRETGGAINSVQGSDVAQTQAWSLEGQDSDQAGFRHTSARSPSGF